MKKLLVALVLNLFFGSLVLAEWPEFRGPTGQGIAENANIPLSWDENRRITWKTEIPGRGYSSPVVLGNQIWLTTAVESPATEEQIKEQFEKSGLDEEKFTRRQVAGNVSLRAVCVDRKSGRMLKNIELFNINSPDAIHTGNSYASCTPVIESGRLYCHFGANGTACVDPFGGKVLWERKVLVNFSVGAGSSPVIYKDLIVLVCDGIDQQFVTALNKHTGETVWRVDRPPIRIEDGQRRKAYSTPLIVHCDGRDQLVIPGAQWVVSYEPETGKEIWRVDHGDGFSNVPRPVCGHGMVYICTGFGHPQLWAIRVDGKGDVTSTHVVWKQKSQIPTKPSPVLVDDLLFIIGDTGIASCFDAISGKPHWKERIGGNHSASPLYACGRVYFFSHEGAISVVKASDKFSQLATSHLEGQIMASPAVLGSALILRSDSKLYRIE